MDYGPFGLLKAIIETLGEKINKLRGRITHDKAAYPDSRLGLHDIGIPSEHTDKVPSEWFWKGLLMEKLEAMEKERAIVDEMIIQDYEERHEAGQEEETGGIADVYPLNDSEFSSDGLEGDSGGYGSYIG